MIKIASIIILLFFCILCIINLSYSDSISLPQGWRLPNKTEFQENWRNKSKNKYLLIKADFNGDGIPDEARLLISLDGTKMGLFAFISKGARSYETYKLEELTNQRLMPMMGIRRVDSGIYKTACGKGYWECKESEVPEIKLKHPSIDYFQTEGANSFFYWDAITNGFKRIWISD